MTSNVLEFDLSTGERGWVVIVVEVKDHTGGRTNYIAFNRFLITADRPGSYRALIMYAYRTRSTPNSEIAHPSSLPGIPGLHFRHHHHHHLPYLHPTSHFSSKNRPFGTPWGGGGSIEMSIFDPVGCPTSWFAPRQFDIWTRPFRVKLGGFSQKSLSFNMAHLEVVETGIHTTNNYIFTQII